MVSIHPPHTARDFFFFFLRGETGERTFTALRKEPNIRAAALEEIMDLGVLLTDRDHPRYGFAWQRFSYRIRDLGRPNVFDTLEGFFAYHDYLVRVLDPTIEELFVAGNRYAMAWRHTP